MATVTVGKKRVGRPKALKANDTVSLHERFRLIYGWEINGIEIKPETLGRISKVTKDGFEFTEVFNGFKLKFKNTEFLENFKEI